MDALPVPQQLDQLELVDPSAQFLQRREVVQIRSRLPQPVGVPGAGKNRPDPTQYGSNLDNLREPQDGQRLPPFVLCPPKHGRLSAKFPQIAHDLWSTGYTR